MMLEHPHYFTHDLKESGHFEYDTEPEKASYIGYFHPAAWLYAFNNPEKEKN